MTDKEKRSEYNKSYRLRMREKYPESGWKEDRDVPIHILKTRLRTRTYLAVKKDYNDSSKTQELLGITHQNLRRCIESKFTEGMTWSNHGDWHVDHIVPLASANTKEDLITLCHYSNLQPLWAEDNLKKKKR